MKKFSLLCFIFITTICPFNVSRSQASLETNTGVYDGREVVYYKKKLKVYLFADSVNNKSYLQRVENFIISKSGVIDSIYTFLGLSMGAIQFTSDKSDALNLLEIFEDSDLFEHVRPYCVISPVGSGFTIPNDPGFSQQWYLKQDILLPVFVLVSKTSATINGKENPQTYDAHFAALMMDGTTTPMAGNYS